MKNAFLLVLAGFVAGISFFDIGPVAARDQFKKAWDKKYNINEPTTQEEKDLAAVAKKANCNICHVGTNRKNRNEYGQAVNKHITTKDVTNVAKMNEALDKVAAAKSKANDPTSPTYGELIAKGKLPVEPIMTNPATAAAPAPADN